MAAKLSAVKSTKKDEVQLMECSSLEETANLFKMMFEPASDAAVQEMACNKIQLLPAGKDRMLQAGVLEHLFKAMSEHIAHAGVQEQACGALRNLAAGRHERKDKMLQAGVLEHLFKAMSEHIAHAGVQEQACGALCSLAAGPEECKDKMLQAGVLERLMKAMSEHIAHAGVQEQACSALRNLAAGPDECKDKMLHAGVLEHLFKTMSEHIAHAGVQQKACLALWHLATGSDQRKDKMLQVGCMDNAFKALSEHTSNAAVQVAACYAISEQANGSDTHKESILRQPRILENVIVALNSEASHWQVKMIACQGFDSLLKYDHWRCTEALQRSEGIQALLHMAGRDERLFPVVASILSHFPTSDLMISGVDSQVVEQLLSASNIYRYTRFSCLVDTFLPLLDVGSDMAGLYLFFHDRQFKWLALQAGALLFNGACSATIAAKSGDYVVAVLNVLSCGTVGQVVDAVRAGRTGVKTANMLSYKICEGVEGFVSLGVAADVLVVSGILADCPSLSSTKAVLRWVSLATSLGGLAKLAFDMDAASMIKVPFHAHQRSQLGRCAFKVLLVLFHTASVCSWLVLAFVATAFPDFGLVAMAILSAVAVSASYFLGIRNLEGYWTCIRNSNKVGCDCSITPNSLDFDYGSTCFLSRSAAGVQFEASSGKVSILLEPSHDVMTWSAGSRKDDETGWNYSWKQDERLVRAETSSMLKVFPGIGCCSGVLRGGVYLLMFGPPACAFNLLSVSSNLNFQWNLAAVKFPLWAFAWIMTGYRICKDGGAESFSPHASVLAALCFLCFMAYPILGAMLHRTGRWKHAADAEREELESSEMPSSELPLLLARTEGFELASKGACV
eukprot:TRINITY_DN8554_c0_g1_i6.p1 TRINITY_DN8554_c0_g1~~TRINITY_DN8554_c0_g1_i6.p1  ORF type:complete len:848 (+),score=165.44 TRINITY_DN8554_c0_g1_i6:60-2603(+)